jgi:hypothetical protein
MLYHLFISGVKLRIVYVEVSSFVYSVEVASSIYKSYKVSVASDKSVFLEAVLKVVG